MRRSDLYTWEVEKSDGEIIRTGKISEPEKVVRCSFVPALPILPKHDIIINPAIGERFIKRFSRGFLKAKDGFNMSEYLNCCQTNRYRFWLYSSGRGMITSPEGEVDL